ncbi:MAG TPA: O-antigen ligase family protein [Saprospiraceae bacterium]|nr:O-antigen ligase family protein [Saprospiraceae bacterium]HMQ83905.1 O-antigen ligase family protein [Saprospiraceae bacterium]
MEAVIPLERNTNAELFPRSIQVPLNWMVFFGICPILDLLGVSFTFYIFILLGRNLLMEGYKIFQLDSFFDLLILIMASAMIISYVFAKETFMPINPATEMMFLVQCMYWLVLILFIKTHRHRINFYEVAQYMWMGITLAILLYYTIGGMFTQNGFAFMMVCGVPIAFYYLLRRFNVAINVFFAAGYIAAALMSQSRAGALVVFGELTLIFSFAFPFVRNLIFASIPVLLLLIGLGFASGIDVEKTLGEIADVVEPYNEDLGELIRDPMAVNETDASWQTRVLMMRKALYIIDQYPITGAGLGRFTDYWADLDMTGLILKGSESRYNRKSAHNSYVMLLGELGFLGFIPFILILLTVLSRAVPLFFSSSYPTIVAFGAAFVGMCIHMWTIAAITGTMSWMLLGMVYSVGQLMRDHRK